MPVVGRTLPEGRAARKRAGFRRTLCSSGGVVTSAPCMLDDAVKALAQMFSPPLRAVLWKSIGLALALIVAVGIALERLIAWLVGSGSASVETTFGPHAHL